MSVDYHPGTPGSERSPSQRCTTKNATSSVPRTSPFWSAASSPFSSPTGSSDSPSSASSSRSPIFDLYEDDSGSETSESSASTVIRLEKTPSKISEPPNKTEDDRSATENTRKSSVTGVDGHASHSGVVFRSRVTFEDASPELDWFRADCDTLEELTALSRKRFKRASIWNDDGRGWARHWTELFIKLHWPDHQDTVKYCSETSWSDLESISQERRTEGVKRCRGILLSAGIVDDLAISLWETLVRHLTGRNPDNDDEESLRFADALKLGNLLTSPLDPNVRPISPGRRASYDAQMTDSYKKKGLGTIDEEDRVASVSDLSCMVNNLSVSGVRRLNALKDKGSNTWGLGRRLCRSQVSRSLGRERAVSPTPALPASKEDAQRTSSVSGTHGG